MTKIKKVNGILGSIALSLAIVILIFAIIGIVKEYIPHRPSNQIISNSEAQENLNDNKRKQIIDYSSIDLLDSLEQVYIIPVHQKILQKAESIESLNLEVIDIPVTRQTKYSSDFGYYSGYTDMNNILLYYIDKNEFRYIFNKRVSIVDFIKYRFKNSVYLFLLIADKDTNEDNILNNSDLLKIYIYDLKNNKLQVKSEGEYIIDSWHLKKSDKIIVRVGVDRNKNNKFDYDAEPKLFKVFDINKSEYSELIPQKINQELQAILDGKSITEK